MYKFAPIIKTKVWGTENWVLSSVPGSESVVAQGPDKGKTLNEVYGGEFPLLVKFIDAHSDLSIQVHPDDALAAKRHGCKGKTEMWYVTGASADAHLYSGLTKEISPEEYVLRIGDGTITEVLGDYKVSPGDVFFIPAGRIHAICGGCRLAEIQETSDITYRIYDYKRPGLDGKPRRLHTDLATDAIDYSVSPDYRNAYVRKENEPVTLVSCPQFITSVLELTVPYACPSPSADGWCVLVCVRGEGSVNGVTLKEGEAALVSPLDRDLNLVPASSRLTLLTSFSLS